MNITNHYGEGAIKMFSFISKKKQRRLEEIQNEKNAARNKELEEALLELAEVLAEVEVVVIDNG